MATRYDKHNGEFSNKAHEQARTKIYPLLFGVEPDCLTFDDDTLLESSERGRVLDGEMAVDRIVRVTVPDLQQPLVLTVQERFRRMQYARYRDITVTEWNHATNQPSELYKLEANLFVYGYFDEHNQTFGEVVTVNTTGLLRAIIRRDIPYTVDRNNKQQSFLAFKFGQLQDRGLIVHHYKPQAKLLQLPPQPAQTRPVPMGIVAKRTTMCKYCRQWIVKYKDRIAHDDTYGWMHLHCATKRSNAA